MGKLLTGLFWGFWFTLSLYAQDEQVGPDYAGFYALNIPGVSWSEGDSLKASFRKVTGRLVRDGHDEVFLTDQMDVIHLGHAQLSRLLMDPSSQQPFDLVGFDGQVESGTTGTNRFFVVYYAVMGDLRMILLIPSMKPKETARNSRSDIPDAITGPSASRLRLR